MRKSTQPSAWCPHRPPCPGCPRFGEPGLAAAATHTLTALSREFGLAPPTVVEGPSLGYRRRSRLAVRGRATSPKVGLFQEGSHRLVDIPRCPIHHARVNDVALALRRAIRATATPPYQERTHRGSVRHLQVVVERDGGRAQVVVVGNGDDPEPMRPLLAALAAELGDALQGLWWNGNPARTNVILGPHWAHIEGEAAVVEHIGGARVFFPPAAFGQANLDLADAIVARVAGWVPDGARVVEFHAGTGAIGLGLATRVRSLAMNEVSEAGLSGLALGIDALPAAARARVSVLPGDASAHAAAARGADVVIADPPRKGLEPALLAALADAPPLRLVLVSCSVDAFVREARTLHAAGLTVRAIVPYALFPYTEHVETVALFERAPAGDQ